MKKFFHQTLTLLLLLPALSYAQITMPVSRIVFQRDNSNRANVPVQGNCPASANSLQVKATAINGGQSADWATIGSAGNGQFSGTINLAGGWYSLQVRTLSNGSEVGNWTLDRVGVGEVILVAGQSNAQGTPEGPDATDDRVSCVDNVNGNIREYELAFNFRHLDGSASVGPTSNKHFYGALGDLLVRRLNVPVLLLGAGVQATSSDQYAGSAQGQLDVPDSQAWDGQQELRPYRAIGATLNHYARRTGLRGILWFQGESDKNRTSGDAYFNNIAAVISKSRSDLGQSVPWVISQTSWMEGSGDQTITSAQSRLAGSVSNCYAGPNTDAYGNDYRRDGTHFATAQLPLLAGLWNTSLSDSFFQNGQSFTLGGVPATVTAALPAPARQYAGGHLYVGFMATGAVNGAQYTVQLLNESGDYLANLGTGSANPIKVFLPTNLDGQYRVRVVSSLPGNASTPSEKFRVFQNGLSKGSGTGLSGTYYPNQDLAGSPAITRVEGPMDFVWTSSPGGGMPGDNRNWSARWTGQIEAPTTGTYTIKAHNDDGTRLWINNQLLINDWNVNPWATPRLGQIYMEGGKRYDIKIELRQDWYDAQVKLLWILPGQNVSQYVPIDRLYSGNQPAAAAPVVSGSFPALAATVNQAINVTLPASISDPANLALTYSYENLPGGLTGSGLTISGTPNGAGSGQYTLTATNTAGLSVSTQINYQIVSAGTPTPIPPVSGGALSATVVSYNCTTGQLVLGSTGGNGTTVEFASGGLTNWTSNTNLTLDYCAANCTDTPPFVIRVRQSGTAGQSFTWSRQGYCSGTPTPTSTPTPTPPVSGGALSATVVSYNCTTGQIVLGSTGGNGTTVEFASGGMTSWTSNPNITLDYCAANCTDTPPFLIRVRQSGTEGQFLRWTRQSYCAAKARQGAVKQEKVSIYLAPNPADDQVTVTLSSEFQSGPLTVSVTNVAGTENKLPVDYSQRDTGTVILNVSSLATGLYLVRLNGESRSHVLKLIKK